MTFRAWLMTQGKRDDSVGILARAVLEDRAWPPTQDMVKLWQYLAGRGSIENWLSALDEAYSEYQKAGNKQRPVGIR